MTEFLLIGQASDDKLKKLVQLINNCIPEAAVREVDIGKQAYSPDTTSLDNYALVLVDYDLGEGQNGLHLIQSLVKQPHVPPIILLLDSTQDSNIAINAMRVGASNYIIKSEINTRNVLQKITDSLEMAADKTGTRLPVTNIEDDTDFFDLTTDIGIVNKKEDEGLVIPGYTIIRELAKGGMSTVLLAKSEEDDSMVVLKVMFLTGQEDQQSLKRFIQEYNLISNLVHPHVIRIFERAFASDFAYIAMEYLPHGDLSSRICEGITPDDALEYLHQIAMGLEAAHKLNIVHRDLKPGNILFNDDNTLVITDFGAAKVLDETTDITIGDAVVGTPYYISPEQGSGGQIDNRSDLYSLGVIFFEMLTGSRPYKAGSIAQLIHAHMNSPIPQLEGEFSIYQPLIDGLLAKEPNERFQKASELIMGIEWIMKNTA
ncbi:MAG TPA: protein kinase [Gammaproteobacteria bacterium]|nr:protein kinase [Gammaproteobacteria bacterium]